MAIFSHLPGTALCIGITLALLAVLEVLIVPKTARERITKVVIAALAIILLCLQFTDGKHHEEELRTQQASAARSQKEALDRQKEDLTAAFHAGTQEIIAQENALQHESRSHAEALTDATMGSNLCPLVSPEIRGGKLSAVWIMNMDSGANIFDLTLYVAEMEYTREGKARFFPQKVYKVPSIPATGSSSEEFPFAAQNEKSFLQYTVATRRRVCSGQIDIHQQNGVIETRMRPIHGGALFNHAPEIPPAGTPWDSKLDGWAPSERKLFKGLIIRKK